MGIFDFLRGVITPSPSSSSDSWMTDSLRSELLGSEGSAALEMLEAVQRNVAADLAAEADGHLLEELMIDHDVKTGDRIHGELSSRMDYTRVARNMDLAKLQEEVSAAHGEGQAAQRDIIERALSRSLATELTTNGAEQLGVEVESIATRMAESMAERVLVRMI
mgnify:CR=1 FL=1|jgi:hypothetical protein